MNKRFVILTGPVTNEQNNAFYEFIKGSEKFAWWHWMPGSWLLTTGHIGETAATIRDYFKNKSPEVNALVIDVTGSDPLAWAGFGPKGEKDEDNMFKWLMDVWSKS